MNLARSRATAFVVGAAVLLAACGGGDGDGGDGDDGDDTGENQAGSLVTGDILTVNSGTPGTDGGELTLGTDLDMSNWNVTSAEGNNRQTEYVARMIMPTAFIPQPDWTAKMNEDLLVSAEVSEESPQTVVYAIQPDAVWSDGQPITAEDFHYTWQVQNGRDCPDCLVNATGGYVFIDDVAASSDGKTVTVTFNEPYINWQNLFQFILPAHLAAEQGDLATSYNVFFGTEVPAWSGGPFVVDAYDKGNSVRLVPNEAWYGEPATLDAINLRFITDVSQQPAALQNDEIQMINTTPTLDLIEQIKMMADRGVVYQTNPGNRWPWVSTNLQRSHLQDAEVREAIFTAINVPEIIAKTVGQYNDNIAPLGSLVHLAGSPDYVNAIEELDLGYGAGDVAAAIETLESAGYSVEDGVLLTPDGSPFPTLEFVTYQTPIYQDIAQVAIENLKAIGVSATLITDPSPIPEKLIPGQYDLSLTVWAATPFSASKAQEVWSSGANFAGYADEEVDELLRQAVSTESPDESVAHLHDANSRMLEAAWALPLFQLPTLVAYYDKYVNVRDNPPLVVGPIYNAAEWGLK